MNKKILLFIISLLFTISCGRQVHDGTTIKVVNDCGFTNDDLYAFEDKLKVKLREFNFTVKPGGATDYTIYITDYYNDSYSWTEYPSDDCSGDYFTLYGEETVINVSLSEYDSKELESWVFIHNEKEKLKKTDSNGCYNYYVGTPLWQLFEGNMDAFARRTARRVSRIVYND